MNLELHVLVGVIAVAMIQSAFGVGVLLFGTPLLLLLGHSFVATLLILLPVSIGISLAQVAGGWRQIDRRFIARTLLYGVPVIALTLPAALTMGKKVGLAIGVLLLLSAAKEVSRPLASALERLARHERSWLALTGAVHGMTNLGGSMLALVVHQKGYARDAKRATIAACYAFFAAFQWIVLRLTTGGTADAVVSNGGYVVAGLLAYAVFSRVVDRRMGEAVYARVFSVFLLMSAMLVTYRSV